MKKIFERKRNNNRTQQPKKYSEKFISYFIYLCEVLKYRRQGKIMDNNNYVLKLKSANIEIEISGPEKDFVTGEFKEVMDRLEDLDVSESGLIQSIKVTTPPSFTSQNPQIPAPTDSPTVSLANQIEPSESGISKFAKVAGITEEELKNIYEFKKDRIYIHKHIEGTTVGERQKTITKLALIANEHVFGIDELSGRKLTEYMRDQGINNSDHLAENLKGDKDSGIFHIKRSYKLNTLGKASAIELIKELAIQTV